MDNKNNTRVVESGGITFCGFLTVALIVLKLCNVVAWPWAWVLAPLWVPTAFWLLVVILILVFATIVSK